MEALMEKSNGFSCFPAIVWKGGQYCFPAFLRWSVRAVQLATFALFMLATVPSNIIMAEDDFDSVYDKASLYFRQGKYEEALSQYKKANRLMQDSNLDCLWGMAQSFSKLGAYRNTMQTCDRLIELSGDNVYFRSKAWNMRGNELSAAAFTNPGKPDLNKLREAEVAYREVLKLSSALNMAHYNLGITLIRLNRVNEGIGELQVYVERAEEEDVAEKARKIIKNPRRAVENYAPDFSIVTSTGEYVSSDELKGKILLLDFWGAWCQPCISAIPFLSDLAKKYRKESFVLISVDVNDDEAKWRDFIDKNRMNWTHTRDGNNKIQRLFQVNAFPTYILVDHEGVIQYRGMGSSMQTENGMTNAIKRALKNLASSPAAVSTPVAASPQNVAYSAPTKTEMDRSGEEWNKAFAMRIPKPAIEVTKAEPILDSEGLSRMNSEGYRIKVRNWASLPDDLFEPSSELMPCSVGAINPMRDSASTRLEILVKSEQGQMLRGFCNPPRPEILQNLMLIITNQPKPDKIYLELKDRLTGNAVQSDPVSLP